MNNIGSNTLSGIGNHYAWGEIDSKPEYTLNNSLLYGKNIKDISGNPQYDVAKAEWGATWRIPSEEEWSELIDNCVWSFITIDDMYNELPDISLTNIDEAEQLTSWLNKNVKPKSILQKLFFKN